MRSCELSGVPMNFIVLDAAVEDILAEGLIGTAVATTLMSCELILS